MSNEEQNGFFAKTVLAPINFDAIHNARINFIYSNNRYPTVIVMHPADDEAVKDYMSKHTNHGIEENGRNRYMSEDAYNNRRSNWNIWACNLFDNEADARKSFG